MKIAVLNNCVPFLRGGAEHLADALTAKLMEYGHQAILVRVPFRWDPPEAIIEHMLACRLMQLPNVDRAIAFKFPAYYIPHPDKIIWLLHQFRQAYDFWGTPFQGLPETAAGRKIRDSVIAADNSYIPEARKLYTNSKVTGDRLRRFNGLESEVLFPPLLTNANFSSKETGDYIVCLGRINSTKRQHLIVEALKHCRTAVQVIVAGSPETRSDGQLIEQIIQRDQLGSRVKYVDRYISEDEKLDLLSRSLACAYLPYDEDSYGYVTLEACLCRKPVITCTDSGGIEALVRHRESGYIVPPEPEALAMAMDELYADKIAARRMGDSSHDLASGLNISWDHVIKTLTA